MSVLVWNKRINLWLQVKYSISCMNNVVLLCFLFLNPGFCLQFCPSIPWHTLWLFCYNLHLLPGMKHVTSSSLRYIFGDYMWFSGYDAEANIKSSLDGHANFMPGMPGMPNQLASRSACHGKPEEQKLGMNYQPGERSGPKFSWVNFGLRGHEPIFSMPTRCYF